MRGGQARTPVRLGALPQIIVMGVLWQSCCNVTAAEAGTESPANSPETDEVVVNATRLKDLREAVIKAEDRMLARYNELNQNHDLDIECLQLTPTGTRLSYRYCLTKLQKRAQQKDSSEYMTYMRNADLTNGQAQPMPEVGVRLMERSEDYRKNLVKLLQENPDLRELLVERGAAERRYEAERGIRRKGKAPH